MRGRVSSMPKYESRNPILEDCHDDDDDQNDWAKNWLIGWEIFESLTFLS